MNKVPILSSEALYGVGERGLITHQIVKDIMNGYKIIYPGKPWGMGDSRF